MTVTRDPPNVTHKNYGMKMTYYVSTCGLIRVEANMPVLFIMLNSVDMWRCVIVWQSTTEAVSAEVAPAPAPAAAGGDATQTGAGGAAAGSASKASSLLQKLLSQWPFPCDRARSPRFGSRWHLHLLHSRCFGWTINRRYIDSIVTYRVKVYVVPLRLFISPLWE